VTVYEHDDQGLRVIGYNQGVFFYDPTRTLRAEIYLQPDNTLNLGGIFGGGGGAPGSTSPHTLGDTVTHLGLLGDNQAPQFLMRDGSRMLTSPWTAGQAITLPNTGLHLLDTDASHDLIIAPGSDLTADRTLTIVTGDADRTLTLANSGTAVVGTGTATRLAVWSDANTIAASTLIKSGAGVLTLDAGGAYTLTVPATGTAALLATANMFTAAQTINVNSTTALLVEQDGVHDSVLVVDTTSGRVGVNTLAPASALDITGDVRVSGTEITVATKNKHEIYLSDGTNPLFRRQTYRWDGAAWVADHGYGFGYAALQNNTGAYANGFGYYALYNNTGANANGFGDYALYSNTGAYANGFGYYALYSNTGAYANGFGLYALYNNTGANANGFGDYALYSNTGADANGFGAYALRHNQAADAIAIGDNAWASFLTNAAGAKTFDYTAVDASTDRITITGHGFGASGTYVNLLYTQGTSAITGLTTATVYQVKIIDADTVGFYEADGPGGAKRGTNITAAGTGTGHTLTPQFTYTSSIVIGHDTNPTKAYQVTLGASDIVETILRGKVLVNTTAVGAQLAVDQESTTGSLPVLMLDQGDVSEPIIYAQSDAADVDLVVLRLGVTGTPTLGWDESEDKFTLSKGLDVTGMVRGTTGLITTQSVANYSDPPTDAELDAAFGTPATLGRGFVALLDDNDADTDSYIVWTSDASWYYIKATKAV
jgi:hypothetical protein